MGALSERKLKKKKKKKKKKYKKIMFHYEKCYKGLGGNVVYHFKQHLKHEHSPFIKLYFGAFA